MSPLPTRAAQRDSADFKAGYEEGYTAATRWLCDKCYGELF